MLRLVFAVTLLLSMILLKAQDSEFVDIYLSAKNHHTKEPLQNINVEVIDLESNNSFINIKNEKNVTIKIVIPYRYVYKIIISKDGYIAKHVVMDFRGKPLSTSNELYDYYDIILYLPFKLDDGCSYYNDFPVGYLKFNRDLGNFEWNKDYIKNQRPFLDSINAEIDRKTKLWLNSLPF